MKKSLLILSIVFICISFLFIGYNFGISKTGSFKSILESSEEHHSPPSVIIEPGSAVETASYIIFKDDEGWIYAKNGDTGEIEFSGTDAATVINNALSSLTPGRTWYETVFFKGIFTIGETSSINVGSWTELNAYQAEFHKEYPDATTPILVNEDQINGNEKIRILGGYFDGHKDDGNSGTGTKGIYIDNNNIDMPSYHPTIELIDVRVTDCYDNLVHIDLSASDGMRLTRVRAFGSTRRAFRLHGGDSWIVDCNAGSFYENLYLSGGRFKVTNFYAGGTCTTEGADPTGTNSAIYLDGNARCKFVNIDLDYCQRNGIIVNGGGWHHFVNVRVIAKDNAQLNNTYTGIKLVNTHDNIIDASFVGKYTDSTTWFYKYGVEETGTSDYNIITDSNFRFTGTVGVILVGENSHVSSSWNGTLWIN